MPEPVRKEQREIPSTSLRLIACLHLALERGDSPSCSHTCPLRMRHLRGDADGRRSVAEASDSCPFTVLVGLILALRRSPWRANVQATFFYLRDALGVS